jgi:DeoR/GlpR family transcriptional regulator of sugar metabolism
VTTMPLESSRRIALPAVRRRHALQLLRHDGAVSCRDLQAAFQISEATARRDISALVRQGHGVRVHGGAVDPANALPFRLRNGEGAV